MCHAERVNTPVLLLLRALLAALAILQHRRMSLRAHSVQKASLQEQQALQRVSPVPQVVLNHMLMSCWCTTLLASECNGHTGISRFDACFCRQIFRDSTIHLHKLQSRYVCTSAALLHLSQNPIAPPHIHDLQRHFITRVSRVVLLSQANTQMVWPPLASAASQERSAP